VSAYHSLDLIKRLIREEQYSITTSAIQSAHAMGFDEDDVCECILDFLDRTHFYKAMTSERSPGLWQDVYKINYRGTGVYLKLQIGRTGTSVVISFKEDTS
jgi:hypothetical protein